MEGGALKGLFTCGVLDVFMENGITFDTAAGVSAGAVFGCNFKSRQIGRPLRYNKRFCKDKRYASWQSFLKTGNLYGVEFCYHTIPWELDLWDEKTFRENPMEFYAVSTDLSTGGPVYYKCEKGDPDDVEWMRASASVPILSKIVEIGGRKLLDGGVADPIPLKFMERQNCDRIVVITTKPAFFQRKSDKKVLMLEKWVYREYPQFVSALMRHTDFYNEQMKYLAQQEKDGKCLVIRPGELLKISGTESDPEVMEHVYQLGRKEAAGRLSEIRDYLTE